MVERGLTSFDVYDAIDNFSLGTRNTTAYRRFGLLVDVSRVAKLASNYTLISVKTSLNHQLTFGVAIERYNLEDIKKTCTENFGYLYNLKEASSFILVNHDLVQTFNLATHLVWKTGFWFGGAITSYNILFFFTILDVRVGLSCPHEQMIKLLQVMKTSKHNFTIFVAEKS